MERTGAERKVYLSRKTSFPIFSRDVGDSWLQLLNLALKIGAEKQTESGERIAEALNVMPSVTPDDEGCQQLIGEILQPLGFELEHLLEQRGDIEMLRRVRQIGDMAQVSYVRQKEQLGLGHAVLMAKELVGHEPFAVILSDDVVQSERSCIGQLIDAYQHTGGSTLAVMEVPREETGRYGIVDIDPEWQDPDTRLNRIRGMVEKPQSDPPSNKAIIGRYVLTPKIFEKLEQTQAGAGGEIQLTDAIEALMKEQEVFSYAFEGTRHDAGTTMGSAFSSEPMMQKWPL